MPILLLSGASLLEKINLLWTVKYFDVAAKIHVSADTNQKIYISIGLISELVHSKP